MRGQLAREGRREAGDSAGAPRVNFYRHWPTHWEERKDGGRVHDDRRYRGVASKEKRICMWIVFYTHRLFPGVRQLTK